jgi:uncharacterized membrane protein (UPF0127 family)
MTLRGVLKNASTGAIIATRVNRARNFLERAVGLLARGKVRPDEGLWIERCRGIHTIGMRAPIDVIFIDGKDCVVGLHASVRPFKVALVCPEARAVVELGAGAIEYNDILVGDRLELH